MQEEIGFVLDDPFDGFPPFKLHGLSHGGREVDVVLLRLFSLDELYFGRESHERSPYLVITLDISYQVPLTIKLTKTTIYGEFRKK
jgi:hypothetical protein